MWKQCVSGCPALPDDLLASVATCWQLVGGISDAGRPGGTPGIRPAWTQRALDYRGRPGSDQRTWPGISGPYTVLETSPARQFRRVVRGAVGGASVGDGVGLNGCGAAEECG